MPIVRGIKRKVESAIDTTAKKRAAPAKKPESSRNEKKESLTPAKVKREASQKVKHEDDSPNLSEDEQAPATKQEIPSEKKLRQENPMGQFETQTHDVAEFVMRDFYPDLMSNERVNLYNTGKIPKPIEELEDALNATKKEREKMDAKGAILHWFRFDLRISDNTALYHASQAAKKYNRPLICMYVVSHQDWRAHMTAPSRIDFTRRTLDIIRQDLEKLNIPLFILEVKKRKTLLDQVFEFCDRWDVGRIYGNIEYEVDELRRDAKLVKRGIEKGIAVDIYHDTSIVPPGQLYSGTGKVYAVFTPYFKSWVSYVQKNDILKELFPSPEANSMSDRAKLAELFEDILSFPQAEEGKRLSMEEEKRLAKLWPAGEHEARDRLQTFLKEKVVHYNEQRNYPSTKGTSALSVHLAAGTLSARQAAKAAINANKGKFDNAKGDGISGWISEIAWRDFYKSILANWPYVCMSKPFKPEYENIRWEYSDETFKAWATGRTGYPYVDAAMRQMTTDKYMHNRARMMCASFFCKHLLQDWRVGEQFWMQNLIDGDFASNNGGWQWCASSGADPQPYFRIFNPLLQSEKFDPNGDYIREWVPELRGLKGKEIHAPYEKLDRKKFEQLGYPKPIVEHKFARERCLQRYKEGLGRDKA